MDLIYFISCFFLTFPFPSCLTSWMVGLLVSLYISHSYLFNLEGYWTTGQGTSLGAELPYITFLSFSCLTILKHQDESWLAGKALVVCRQGSRYLPTLLALLGFPARLRIC